MNTTAIRTAAAALLLATSACIDNRVSIEPYAVCFPGEPGNACSPVGKCSSTVSSGTLYLERARYLDGSGGIVTNEFLLPMQWNNQLPKNDDLSAGRGNTNDAFIREYRFTYASPAGFILPEDYPVLRSATVPANNSLTAWVPFIPSEIAAELITQMNAGVTCTDPTDPTTCSGAVASATVVVEVVAAGIYGDDTEFETAPFQFPIEVINEVFPGYGCPTGQVVTAVCPNAGQTSTFTCEAPATTTP